MRNKKMKKGKIWGQKGQEKTIGGEEEEKEKQWITKEKYKSIDLERE